MKRRFWAQPRLCLCLVFSVMICSCGVLRTEESAGQDAKMVFEITGELKPGFDGSAIFGNLFRTTGLSSGDSGKMVVIVRAGDDVEFIGLKQRILDAGVQITGIKRLGK